jgi:hypothetical protein
MDGDHVQAQSKRFGGLAAATARGCLWLALERTKVYANYSHLQHFDANKPLDLAFPLRNSSITHSLQSGYGTAGDENERPAGYEVLRLSMPIH